jgi:hypothetical protein
MRINMQNQRRIRWFNDDYLGKPAQQTSRLNTAMKALAVIGYGVTATDAYMKAKEGAAAKEVTKALTAALAGDVAGSAAAAVYGGGAGLIAGVGAGMVAGVVVYGTVEFTDEAVENMLGGFKVDTTVKKVFLDQSMVEKFLKMSPQEIRDVIGKEWDIQEQWSGTYYGKMGDEQEQADMKNRILEKALETQSHLNHQVFKTKIIGEIVRDELNNLVQKYDNKEISGAKMNELTAALKKQGDPGAMPFTTAWRYLFGTDFNDIVQQQLAKKYPNYKTIFDQIGQGGERSGLWDYVTRQAVSKKEQDAARARVDGKEGIQSLRTQQEYIKGVLNDFDRHLADFKKAFKNRESQSLLDDLFAQLKGDIEDLLENIRTFENGAATFSYDLVKSYGKDDDLTQFYTLKSELSRMLAKISGGMENKEEEYAQIKKLMDMLKLAKKDRDDKDKKDDDDADDRPQWAKNTGAKDDDDRPQWAKNTGAGDDDDQDDQDETDEQQTGGPRDDYEVIAITVETEPVAYQGKRYEKLIHTEAASIIIRMRGKDHIIDGNEAVSILLEKGYFRRLAGVGIVSTTKVDTIVTYRDVPKKNIFGQSLSQGCEGKPLDESCKAYQKCGAKLGSLVDSKKRIKLSGKEYWDVIMCRQKKKECLGWYANDCSFKIDEDFDSGIIRTPMSEEDAKVFGPGVLRGK